MQLHPSAARQTCRSAPTIALAGAALLAGLTSAYKTSALAAEHTSAPAYTVTIDGVTFSPQTLVVPRGARITWINKDPFPHTVTAMDKAFDSRSLAAGASWTYIARSTGEHDYICTLHPTMKGKITVQ
jgi:plastocyanin